MRIIAVDHITINVIDLEKSEEFYENILKLEKTGFINMEDHTLTYYKLTENTRLELISYLTLTMKAEMNETSTGCYRHFCLQVDDIQGIYDECQSAKVFVRKRPSYVDKLKANTMLIIDPNGVEIELIAK